MANAPGEGFHIPYPSWYFVTGTGFDADGVLTGNPKLVAMQDDGNELSLPIFTDSDLAERFHNASGETPSEAYIGIAETAEKLAHLLDEAKRLGITFVVFDPARATGANSRVWPIEYAVGRIRNGEDLM